MNGTQKFILSLVGIAAAIALVFFGCGPLSRITTTYVAAPCTSCSAPIVSTLVPTNTPMPTTLATEIVATSTNTPAPTATTAPTAALTALWTPATCTSISIEMGIPLKVLDEGNGFTACKYIGPIVKINIPNFTIVDADRGGTEDWVNSDQTVQLEAGDMTFRQWNGKLDSACAQVKNLQSYLDSLGNGQHATPGNFVCPAQ